MDGTANEVKGIAVKGFPTLLHFATGAKTAATSTTMTGGRDFASLKKYIDTNAEVESESKDEL